MQISQYPEEDLLRTWAQLLQKNKPHHKIQGTIMYLTDQDKAEMIDRKYPKKCLFTELKPGKNTNKGRSGSDRGRKKVSGSKYKNSDKVIIYQLACFVSCGYPSGKVTASHLCGDSQCCNPGHVCWESLAVNHTRDCCKMFKSVPDYKCPHNPPCKGFKAERLTNSVLAPSSFDS